MHLRKFDVYLLLLANFSYYGKIMMLGEWNMQAVVELTVAMGKRLIAQAVAQMLSLIHI